MADQKYVPGQIIVGFQKDVLPERWDGILARAGYTILGKLKVGSGYCLVSVPIGTEREAITKCLLLSEVRNAELNGLMRPAS